MAYSNSNIKIHGNGVTHFNAPPTVSISLSVSDVTRSGNTISCNVSASLNALVSPNYFGYYIRVYAQLDSGTQVQLIDKDNSPNRWSKGSYGLGTKKVSATSTQSACTLKILLESNCYLSNGDGDQCSTSREAVYFVQMSAPAATYTISYDANGGSNAPSSQTKNHGTNLTLRTAKPTGPELTLTLQPNHGTVSTTSKKYNKAFKNWNTKKNGSGDSYNSGGTFTKNQNATLYAQWNAAKVSGLPTPTRSGYQFKGWFNSSGQKIENGSTITGNTTVTAQWLSDEYVVSYNANGGSGAPAAQTKYHGQALTLRTSTPTRSITLTYHANGGSGAPASKSLNTSFNKWKDSANNLYSAGGQYTRNASDTLYAQWNSAAIGTLPTPTRSNCIFAGWYTAIDGGSQVTATTTRSSNSTIYARWNYIVKYNLNDGSLGDDSSGKIANATKVHGQSLTLTSIKPTKRGKEFIGWAESKSATTHQYSPGGSYTKNEPKTLYAVYKDREYTVKFDLGGGTATGGGSTTQKVSHGKDATPPTGVTKEDSKFLGWLGSYKNITSDRTIKAIWAHCPVWIMTTTNSKKKWQNYLDKDN